MSGARLRLLLQDVHQLGGRSRSRLSHHRQDADRIAAHGESGYAALLASQRRGRVQHRRIALCAGQYSKDRVEERHPEPPGSSLCGRRDSIMTMA